MPTYISRRENPLASSKHKGLAVILNLPRTQIVKNKTDWNSYRRKKKWHPRVCLA